MGIQKDDKVVVTHSATKYDGRDGYVLELLPRHTYRVKLSSRERQVRRAGLRPGQVWFTSVVDPAVDVVFSLRCLTPFDND